MTEQQEITLFEVAQLFVDWSDISSREFQEKYPGLVDDLRTKQTAYWTTNDAFMAHCRDLFRSAISKATGQPLPDNNTTKE